MPFKEIGGYLHALEGPFGDHTGYYNEPDWFPVFEIERMTHRRDPIYHSTYTGKPPDEPAVLGVALNEVFVPILQKQFPEIVDFYLPPEGCSYRMAIVSIRKRYPGHAKRVMFGIWSFLRQFMYTKFIVVTDEDVDIRDWPDVIWAITTRMDPVRDTVLVDRTPIDSLDFASPVSGLGGKMGLDATSKGRAKPSANGAGRSATTRRSRRGSPASSPRSPRPGRADQRAVLARRRAARRARTARWRAGGRRSRCRSQRGRRPLRPGLQPFRHADQDAARQRCVAVEHRLRRSHAARAAFAHHASAPGQQRFDGLRRLRPVALPFILIASSALCQGPCSGPADWLALVTARRTRLPSSRCWRAPP